MGLVSLAGGDAVLALGVLTGSLIASATLGPLILGIVAQTTGHAGSLSLLGRFGLVVIAPLAAGLLLRGGRPAIARADGLLNGLSSLTGCLLLYVALSGARGGHQLLADAIASLLFVILAGLVALVARRMAGDMDAVAVLLATWLRDFAVAAALASQAFGPAAAGVAGIYGALMLFTGAATATLLRSRGAEHPFGRDQAS